MLSIMNKIKENQIPRIYFLFVFLFFLLFFSISHPPIITTSDDWHFMATTRDAIPIPYIHNPTRVMVEVFAPYAGMISVSILKPFGVDFVSSLAYGTSFFLSCFIVLYAWSFYRLIKEKFFIGTFSTLCITTFFLLFHFLAFRRYPNNNPYLFGSIDLCCYYHYTIPYLLITSLVMYCIRTNLLDKINQKNPWKIGIFLTLVYLVIFSHLYSSIIWITYIFVRLLFIYFFQKRDLSSALKENKLTIASLFIYLFVLLLETTGNNAHQLTEGNDFWRDLHHTLGCYLSILRRMNKWFMCFCFLVFIYSIYIYRSKHLNKSSLKSKIAFFVANFAIINLFYILISAKATPEYVTLPDRLCGESFWGILGVSCCMAYCLKNKPQIKKIVPFLFLLLLGDTNTTGKTFRDVYMFETVAENSLKFAKLAEIADQNNIDSLNVYVPFIESDPKDLNWPYTISYDTEIAETFQKFNVTKRFLKIKIIAVKGRKTLSTELNPNENDSIIADSFWWGEENDE